MADKQEIIVSKNTLNTVGIGINCPNCEGTAMGDLHLTFNAYVTEEGSFFNVDKIMIIKPLKCVCCGTEYNYTTKVVKQPTKRQKIVKVAFILTMPQVGSWNGQFSGEGNLYAKIRELPEDKARKIEQDSSYYYNFGDGWGASIRAEICTKSEANHYSKKSKGFMSYDWMIDSIIEHGKIMRRDNDKKR